MGLHDLDVPGARPADGAPGGVSWALSPTELQGLVCEMGRDTKELLGTTQELTELMRESMREGELLRKRQGEALDHLDGIVERLAGCARALEGAAQSIVTAADRFSAAAERLAAALGK